MANGRPRNPGQMICPITGRRCPHEEPPPPCRHVLQYAEPEQDDLQMLGLMLDQQAQRARQLEAPTPSLTAQPSAQDLLLRPATIGSEAINPVPPKAIEAPRDPLYALPQQQQARRGK